MTRPGSSRGRDRCGRKSGRGEKRRIHGVCPTELNRQRIGSDKDTPPVPRITDGRAGIHTWLTVNPLPYLDGGKW